jgi:hypothetical protein
MKSEEDETQLDAETRFRRAFERLKNGTARILPRGLPVSQNNVAREAGCDPTALKKSRFPDLVREIQAHCKLRESDQVAAREKAKKLRASKKSAKEQLSDMKRQRDHAQSILVSASLRILELTEQVHGLEMQLENASNVKRLPQQSTPSTKGHPH